MGSGINHLQYKIIPNEQTLFGGEVTKKLFTFKQIFFYNYYQHIIFNKKNPFVDKKRSSCCKFLLMGW